MRGVEVKHILHFKENLSVLLISGLFILLAARLDLQALLALGPATLVLLAVIQWVARPLNVALSTFGSSLNWRERGLLAWIAPRGIVAAAVSAIFAERLQQQGYAQAQLLVPLTFLVIIGTVVLQSATARPLARLLGIAEPAARGFLIIGANPVAGQGPVASVVGPDGRDLYWAPSQTGKLWGSGNARYGRDSRFNNVYLIDNTSKGKSEQFTVSLAKP